MAPGEDWIRAAPASRTWKQKDYAQHPVRGLGIGQHCAVDGWFEQEGEESEYGGRTGVLFPPSTEARTSRGRGKDDSGGGMVE